MVMLFARHAVVGVACYAINAAKVGQRGLIIMV